MNPRNKKTPERNKTRIQPVANQHPPETKHQKLVENYQKLSTHVKITTITSNGRIASV